MATVAGSRQQLSYLHVGSVVAFHWLLLRVDTFTSIFFSLIFLILSRRLLPYHLIASYLSQLLVSCIMNYSFEFDEADFFARTQSVTDEHIDRLAQLLPVELPFHNPVHGHAMSLPTPPDSSEGSVTPPHTQSARTAAPKKSRAKPQKQPNQKAASVISTPPKKQKKSAPRTTPQHIAEKTNEELFDIPADDAKKIMGERLLEFLLEFRECDLKMITGEADHSRIAHAKARALEARAIAQGRSYAEVLADFSMVSRSGRDKAEKAANAASKKRSAADADVEDVQEVTIKKARKTPAATTQVQGQESEDEGIRSESTMRDLGYSIATTTGGLQPYVSPYDQETQYFTDTDPIFNLLPTTNLIWNNVLPFNARHDEFAACIDHSCAEGNGFSNLCSEEYLASIGLSGPTDNPYLNNYSLPTGSQFDTQITDWDALNAAAGLLFPDLSRAAIDAQIQDANFLTYGSNNFAMMATDQVSQAQGVRSDLTMGVPSGGAVSSQHMVGPIVGSNEFAAHRPADIGLVYGVVAETAALALARKPLDLERKGGSRYDVFDSVSEIDAFDFDGALYGDAEDFFGGPPLFE